MLELKLAVDSDGGSVDASDSPSLGLPMIETGRGDYNLITYIPINCILDLQEAISWVDGVGEHGPGVLLRLAVHGELAFQASNSLVSEHRLLGVIVVSVHDEVEIVKMRLLLSSCDESSTNKSDETSLNCDIFFV